MKVYLLERNAAYEGSDVIGVYLSETRARAAAEELTKSISFSLIHPVRWDEDCVGVRETDIIE